jgi:hypothetical protein
MFCRNKSGEIYKMAFNPKNHVRLGFLFAGFWLMRGIAILAAILLKGSQPIVGRRNSAWVALGGVSIYTVLVGVATSVVRGVVMAVLIIFVTLNLSDFHWVNRHPLWPGRGTTTVIRMRRYWRGPPKWARLLCEPMNWA